MDAFVVYWNSDSQKPIIAKLQTQQETICALINQVRGVRNVKSKQIGSQPNLRSMSWWATAQESEIETFQAKENVLNPQGKTSLLSALYLPIMLQGCSIRKQNATRRIKHIGPDRLQRGIAFGLT